LPGTISPADLDALLHDRDSWALIDVRDAAEYNEGHIVSASLVPRSLLEMRLPHLVPNRGTRIVIYDSDGQRAALSARTLEGMGYLQVSVLNGGMQAWLAAGYAAEWGMNVPSKDFGERVLVEQAVPEITPEELHDRMQRGDAPILLDTRTPEEHRHDCIPGSRSVPGGELALRIRDIVPDLDSPVVVHCAGRTRSIIGTQTLRALGYRNVRALRNGTMGWLLAGLELETGSDRTHLPDPSPESVAQTTKTVMALLHAHGVRLLDPAGLTALLARSAEGNIYLIDVRTAEEYDERHIPGSRWFPGGQAVQRSDDVVAVRAGHIVFICDGIVRAGMTAVWYRQMGFPHVYVLDGGLQAWLGAGLACEQGVPPEVPNDYEERRARVRCLPPEMIATMVDGSDVAATVLHVDTSRRYAQGHIAGSWWLPRGWLELRIAEVAPSFAVPLIVTCATGVQSVLAADTLQSIGYVDVSVLDGGLEAWTRAGLDTETGLTRLAVAAQDEVRTGVERTRAEMLRYLAWEEALGQAYRQTAP
jgi:rhodanese-related sulfurtransferase